MSTPLRERYIKEMPDLVIGDWPALDFSLLPSPVPIELTGIRRLDMFAMFIVSGLTGSDYYLRRFVGLQRDKPDALEVLAHSVYDFAEALDAEAQLR